jgi:NTE family protein
LAGGGVAGCGFHAGALASLEAATGWDPRSAELMLGTSSGSIVTAILRSGVGPEELRARMMVAGPESETHDPLRALLSRESFRTPKVWRGPAAPNLVAAELRRGRRLRPSNLLVGGLPQGRVETTPLRTLIENFHARPWSHEPLWVTATDLRTGRRAAFGRDGTDVELGMAVQASCAVPGYFAPVRIGDRYYIDGGMRSPDNADLLLGHGLDVVVISSPLSVDRVRVARSPAVSAIRAYPRRQLFRNVEALRAEGVDVLVIQPDPVLARKIGVNAMRPSKLQPIISASVVAVAKQLAALERTGEPRPAYRALGLLSG